MPICISCSTPVRNLYTTYSKADDRSLGKGVRLTQCPNCKRFADKYVEHDFVVLFIDLVLIKPQVYRHLLFNRLGQSDGAESRRDGLDPSIIRLGVLLILFDVYLTWARIEKANATAPGTILTDAPILVQYLFFLTLNVLATLAQHAVVRILARLFVAPSGRQTAYDASPLPPGARTPEVNSPQRPNSHPPRARPISSGGVEPRTTPAARGSAITTALLVSSCTKLFPILLVIWPTSMSDSESQSPDADRQSGPNLSFNARNFIGYAVLVNNLEALLILLDCGYIIATALAIAGAFARWSVESFLLGAVGLEAEGGPIGDLMGVASRLGSWFR